MAKDQISNLILNIHRERSLFRNVQSFPQELKQQLLILVTPMQNGGGQVFCFAQMINCFYLLHNPMHYHNIIDLHRICWEQYLQFLVLSIDLTILLHCKSLLHCCQNSHMKSNSQQCAKTETHFEGTAYLHIQISFAGYSSVWRSQNCLPVYRIS